MWSGRASAYTLARRKQTEQWSGPCYPRSRHAADACAAQRLASPSFHSKASGSCVIDNSTCGSGQGMNHWTGEYQSQVSRLASMFSELEAMHKCAGATAASHHQTISLRNDRSSINVFFLLRFICFMKMIVSLRRVSPSSNTTNKKTRFSSVQPEENGKKSLRRTITLRIFSLIIDNIFQLDESRLFFILFRHRLPTSLN